MTQVGWRKTEVDAAAGDSPQEKRKRRGTKETKVFEGKNEIRIVGDTLAENDEFSLSVFSLFLALFFAYC